MSITRAQVTTLAELAAWMQANAVPNIFKSVTYNNSILTATDADDNTVLTIKGTQSSDDYFRAYREENNYIGVNFGRFPHNTQSTINIIGCDNGFMFNCVVHNTSYQDAKFAALVTKTNNDRVAIIFPSTAPSSSPQQYTTALNHVAFGDSATIGTTTTFTPESGNQTNFAAFCTNADITDTSYTPNAFYLPMHSAYSSGIGKFLSGNKVYITNGYWAIDSEEDAT